MPKTQPSRPTTTGEPQAVRADIIAAATKVFSELGYHGASMTDVASELGMRKPSLYHHVRRKEDLLFAIHEQMVDELIAETMVVFSSSKPPSEKLRDIVRGAMDFVGRHQDGVTVFLAEHRALSGERWSEIVLKRDFYERMVQGVINDGTRSGAFVDMPPKIAAKAVLAMANWGYTWFQTGGEMGADEIGDMFAEIALRGLEVRPG
ncbi:Transcriptional regulator TetR family [Patulibacter medicamentivorans]|jgi:AcrR family transcriptional regulator|uniref:Transcriptional regulator TetR family n=1 Tax=Patulibacter medicamentivorans TaxID=1097667 RepID=H0E032_9ACTN|nr:TetR/AcrR family transcriptional regulator [Patulibacter medicamentivorans]EHN12991.1 Transcriptional regulator TetR family [Patulibacter medicamentivorans]